MLMVTTTEGMLNGVHSNTTDLWPAVTFDLVLVVSTTGLQEGLVDTSTTSNDTNGATASRVKNLLGAGRKLDSGLASVWVVRDDDARVARGLGDLATVTDLHLDGTASGTFGHFSDGKNVANVEGGLVATVDGLAGGGALGGDERLGVLTVLVAVLEVNLHEGSTTAGVVDDVLDDTLDEAVTLGEVNRAVLSGPLAGTSNGLEDATGALTTSTDNASHFYLSVRQSKSGSKMG